MSKSEFYSNQLRAFGKQEAVRELRKRFENGLITEQPTAERERLAGKRTLENFREIPTLVDSAKSTQRSRDQLIPFFRLLSNRPLMLGKHSLSGANANSPGSEV